jgi:hypothetical protein
LTRASSARKRLISILSLTYDLSGRIHT